MLFYNIVIQPIEYIIEVIFVLMNRFCGHPGYAIAMVSLAVSFLTLPLYIRADAIQAEERAKQEKMKRWVKHIRDAFQKEERYMMLSAYYAESGYRPLNAFKSTISLLLQIPFFIAAYHFLSHLALLKGCSFGPIPDLGEEDAIFRFGG
ncbi:MAG: YidC/Oxa1 family membrane protein insertase [Lachnospiraceae bacterium]|nr:YidC/Oxa1 family membrane protein insertase [Lachnospiraceae bacterium]